MTDTDEVLYAVADGIATLTLNRPERLNTISHAMLDRLAALLTQVEADPDVRVVVLTGSGRAFCAGLNLVAATAGEGIGSGAAAHPPTLDLRTAPPTVLHAMDTPVVCALNGSAAGYGMDLAIGCDIRVMAASAKLAPAFVKRGIVPESGGTWLLPRMLGWAKAAEIVFIGRTLGAEECLRLGLVNRVVPDAEVEGATQALAREIADNAPLAVQASKRMMRMGQDETFETHVQHVYLQLLPLFGTADFQEGMRAFLEKRPAEFTGR